jgi:L-amino acid N-acyltransferase YncA
MTEATHEDHETSCSERMVQLQALGLNPSRLDRLLGLCRVRPARADDAAALAEIFNETVFNGHSSLLGRPVSPAEMALEIQSNAESGWPFWVCLSRQCVVAFVNLRPFSWASVASFETAEFAIYIGASWQGIGLGSEMYTLALVLAEKRGCHNLACWILGNDSASLKLARNFYSDWACFPSLAFSGEIWCDVHVLGTPLELWFAGARGRRVRRRQLQAAARSSRSSHLATLSITPCQGASS